MLDKISKQNEKLSRKRALKLETTSFKHLGIPLKHYGKSYNICAKDMMQIQADTTHADSVSVRSCVH